MTVRKIGLVCALLGAMISAATGLIQRTAWFAAEQARALSETEEFVVSFFWAGLVLLLVGLILFARSFVVKDEEASFEDYLPQEEAEELVWVCPRCGTENPDEARFCTECGWQDGDDPDLRAAEQSNWQCPWCGSVWDDSASVCTACGYRRFE